jgi:L-ascorbate metabolism protein UlaG (beta-lactamase superfamily)
MKFSLSILLFSLFALSAGADQIFERDVIKTTAGDLEIFFIGHGSLLMKFRGRSIHVDPYSKLADYAKMPKADLLLITHEHQDHLDPVAIGQIRTPTTVVVTTATCAEKLDSVKVMKNGDVVEFAGVTIEAVPAYNLVHTRENGEPFHPKGRGNGYILTFGSTRVYVAGDTENTPEMKALRNIDVAFLPMNLPYTMTPEMAADAAKAFKPKILYPYHYGDTDPSSIVSLLKKEPRIEVRIQSMQ